MHSNVPVPKIQKANQPIAADLNLGLQILKRPAQDPSPIRPSSVPSKEDEEARRIAQWKKYEQARDRIFGTSSTGIHSPQAPLEKKVWQPSEKGDGGGLPVRAPKGPGEGRGFASTRGRRRDA